MIGQLAAAAETAFEVLERAWGWRHFGFGPPTDEYTHIVFGQTSVHRDQVGLSLQWSGAEDGLTLLASAGPLDLRVTVAGFDATALHPPVSLHRRWVIRSRGGGTRNLHLYAITNQLGALLEWGHGLYRVSAGPLGFVVEPGVPDQREASSCPARSTPSSYPTGIGAPLSLPLSL